MANWIVVSEFGGKSAWVSKMEAELYQMALSIEDGVDSMVLEEYDPSIGILLSIGSTGIVYMGSSTMPIDMVRQLERGADHLVGVKGFSYEGLMNYRCHKCKGLALPLRIPQVLGEVACGSCGLESVYWDI
jgi:DNA-directed RNA polymerase subunit RPC12/RpoP